MSGSPIQAHQIGHRFLLGCGAFDSVEMMQTESPERRAFYEERMNKGLRLFNYGTLPFYWGRYEPEEGQTLEEPTLEAARFLQNRGVKLKGHPLCWHTACAPWLLQYSNEEIMERQLKRIQRDVTAFRGVIDMWDVINEVVIMPVFDKNDNAITRICREQGRIKLVKKVFEQARESNPDATLLINDFNTSEAYVILLEGLLEAGVPISAIGIQSHQHQGYWGLEKLHDVLDRYSRFGLPIHFTENTFVSGALIPPHIVDLNDFQVDEWPSTPEGEARQAEEAAEFYSTLFAHPLVEAITTWDFTDGRWLKAPSGVLHADNTEKPVYHKLMNLIHGEWETHVSLTTDESGYADLTGFKGRYSIKAGNRSFEFDLDRDQDLVLTL